MSKSITSFLRATAVALLLCAGLAAALWWASPWLVAPLARWLPTDAIVALDRGGPAAAGAWTSFAPGGGELRPLADLLGEVERELPGRMIDVELDDEDGRRVAELDWLLPDGRKLELTVDARTGEWLKLEGPRLETAFREPRR